MLKKCVANVLEGVINKGKYFAKTKGGNPLLRPTLPLRGTMMLQSRAKA